MGTVSWGLLPVVFKMSWPSVLTLTEAAGLVVSQELQALGDAIGTVSRGLPPAVAAALPRHAYRPPRRASAQEEQ